MYIHIKNCEYKIENIAACKWMQMYFCLGLDIESPHKKTVLCLFCKLIKYRNIFVHVEGKYEKDFQSIHKFRLLLTQELIEMIKNLIMNP